MRQLATYLLSVAIFLAMTGCTLEQRLAKTFIQEEIHDDFYLLVPDIVFKTNLKTFEIDGSDTLDELTRDSLLFEKSLFLKMVSDSVMIGEYASGVKKGLARYGARVLPENAVDTLMNKVGSSFILNIAQFSLEEYVHPFKSEEQVYDEIIVIDDIDLNAVNYNAWLELGRMNSEKKNKVLFLSDYLLDQIDGTLKQNLISGKLSFDYTIDTLTLSQMYAFAGKFGEKTAEYLFDYMMNTYIAENLPEDYPYEKLYYHYDPVRRYTYPINEDERIIELDSP